MSAVPAPILASTDFQRFQVPSPYYVDPMDTTDPFPAIIWAALNCEVGRATLQEKSWSGGRYGCACALKDELAELQHYSLGQVQHLVQLALKKKILGYQGGALAPFVFSNEAKKIAKSKTAQSELSEQSDESYPETPPRQLKSRAHTPPTPPRPPLPSPDDAPKFDQLLANRLGMYVRQPTCGNGEMSYGCSALGPRGADGSCAAAAAAALDDEEEPELPLKPCLKSVDFEEEGVKVDVKTTFITLRGPEETSRRVKTAPDEIFFASDRSAALEACNQFQKQTTCPA